MKLWSHNFYWTSETNLWLYSSMYALFIGLPLPAAAEASGMLWIAHLCFLLGIWLPGPVAAHLLERFSRKHIYLYSLAGCLLCTLLVPYADRAADLFVSRGLTAPEESSPLALLRLVQGLCYGMALNAGNTLSVDVTPSPRRDGANSLFMRTGRIGIGIGLIAATLSAALLGPAGTYYFSLAAGTLAFFSACLLHVPFHAPLRLSLCSTDRYLMPRLWPEILNTLLLAAVPGILAASILQDTPLPLSSPTAHIGLWMAGAAGFLGALLLQRRKAETLSPSVRTLTGFCIAAASCLCLLPQEGHMLSLAGLFLLTAGVELAASGLLHCFVRMARHSQRCTATNSYLLAWESGFAGGICLGIHRTGSAGQVALCLALAALLFFLFFTRRHYKRNKILQAH